MVAKIKELSIIWIQRMRRIGTMRKMRKIMKRIMRMRTIWKMKITRRKTMKRTTRMRRIWKMKIMSQMRQTMR